MYIAKTGNEGIIKENCNGSAKQNHYGKFSCEVSCRRVRRDTRNMRRGAQVERDRDKKSISRAGRLSVIFWSMAKIGCFTFGGGWSIIGQMQNEFVEKRGWMTQEQIIDFMSLAKSFPGIMIINMSVLCGYAMEGVPGALAAAFGLSMPAIFAIGLVTYFYDSLKNNLYIEKILGGVRCVVIPIILQAAWKLKEKSLVSRVSLWFLAASFFVCAFTNVSKPLVILAGAVLGLMVFKDAGSRENEGKA